MLNRGKVHVVVDNDSWIMPYAGKLCVLINAKGGSPVLCMSHREIGEGYAAFYLGCVKIVPPEVLERNRWNLVVHESDLPMGRGFSPLTWQIIEGKNIIPVCLFEAVEDLDAGPVIYKEYLEFNGTELIGEMRGALGDLTVELCVRFLCDENRIGIEQKGQSTYYPRRYPRDSGLDVRKSLAEQFNLLRTVDNVKYPAFFDYAGHRYVLRIEEVRE